MGDVASPFFPDVARGAEDVLAAAGYSLILSSSRRDPERERRNVKHLLERSSGRPDPRRAAVPARGARRAGPARRRPDGVPEPRGEGAPRRRGVDRLAERHRRGRELPRRSGPPAHRARRAVAERRAGCGNREDWYRPALARAGLGPERGAGLPGGDVARGRARRRPAPPGAPSPPDRGHLPQRRDGDRAPAGLRRAARARAPRPVDRRLGRRALREPRHAPAHHRARAPVRAGPGRGAKAARPDGGPARGRGRAGARPPARRRRSSGPPGGGPSRVRGAARVADPPAKGGARRARRRSSSVS